MSIKTIKGDGFNVEYHDDTNQMLFKGTIRFQTQAEYIPIHDLLQLAHDASAASGKQLLLDFHQLEYLNSAGINAISKFVIQARKAARIELAARGNKAIYWQQKSLHNLKKLWLKVSVDIS